MTEKTAPWMKKTLTTQLSEDRDFPNAPPVNFQYGILCTHRIGSNLLSESLYATGMAGDPMEFFNIRMLKQLYKQRGVEAIPPTDYIAEMKKRRTSPNGVFGFNIKFDQYNIYFKDHPQIGQDLIKASNMVIFLYRKDKIRQAVSIYIGRQRDTFRIPAGADYQKIEDLVASVPMNPAAIAQRLFRAIAQEQQWLLFLHHHKIPYIALAYEDLVDNYEGTIDHLLEHIGVPQTERKIPTPPTMKISTSRNDELRQEFLDFIGGEKAIYDILTPNILTDLAVSNNQS